MTSLPRRSARVIVVKDGKLLVMHRKRMSITTGEWIEYYSIPGGGIDAGETPEQAAIREIKEEMNLTVEPSGLIAHRVGKQFEHYVFQASVIGDDVPVLPDDSEEARVMKYTEQIFEPLWVNVSLLNKTNLRYYSDYLDLIQHIASGKPVSGVLEIVL